MDEKQALELIEKSAYRVTRTRQLIVQTVFKLKAPFSANDIVTALASKKRTHAVDLVTIYRNLPVLEQVGVICRSDFSDDMTRYMISHPGHNHHHHHIICRTCQKVEPIDFCILEGQEQILSRLGFKDIRHRLEFSAVCRMCS